MRPSTLPFVAAFCCGIVVGLALLHRSPLAYAAQSSTPAHPPFRMMHFFTGPDGQTHFDEITVGAGNPVRLLPVKSAELHRAEPGAVTRWHTAPQRQYVITLSGHGEIDSSDGHKIELGPGSIELAEDLTGKGHITRTIGNEDRVTLWLPISDNSAPAAAQK